MCKDADESINHLLAHRGDSLRVITLSLLLWHFVGFRWEKEKVWRTTRLPYKDNLEGLKSNKF